MQDMLVCKETLLLLIVWITTVQCMKEVDKPIANPPCIFNAQCSCSNSQPPNLGSVKCENVHLARVPAHINSSKLFTLHLENNGLRSLDPLFFQTTGVFQISVKDNPLTIIPDESFLGLERSLVELRLTYCELSRVPNRALRYMQKLKVLDLTGNSINKISPDNFKGLENSLQHLILSENDITNIPVDSFSGLPRVETIDLRGNHLRNIDPLVFRDGMNLLEHLILADNQLTAIPYQALQPLRPLKTLDLSYNKINKMTPATEPGVNVNLNFKLSVDTLRLDYNQLTMLESFAFQNFDVANKTYLDGNNIDELDENAFRNAKIRELYLRKCGLTDVSPTAFGGLENYLEILDLSGNNISLLPQDVFHNFGLLKQLFLRDNVLLKLNPVELFNGFQFTLHHLDLSGSDNVPISIQDLRRLRSLRSLSLSRLSQPHLSSEDFAEFGIDLSELQITSGGLQSIKNNAFKHVHGLKEIDLSDNSIGTIENNAFTDIAHSLKHLKLCHALSYSTTNFPSDPIKVLTELEELDLSNNRIRTMPETSFHFLAKLRKLNLRDNNIELVHKGTFQADIHKNLEEVLLSFNDIRTISQHTFVALDVLSHLYLDDNKLESIEKWAFADLRHLNKINLKGNKLKNIAFEAFQNLPELEDLDMSYNKLTNLDFSMFDQVGQMATTRVNISHNNLKDLMLNIPSSMEGGAGLGSTTNIKVLDLSFNNITIISNKFFSPIEVSLSHLYLSHNSILNASREAFGNMPHLQWLDLSYNNLYEIDFDTFRNTKNLQVLHLSHNKLSDMPLGFFRYMTNLREVDFSHNRFKHLPEHLFTEHNLERLDLSHNMLTRIPLNSLENAAASSLRELDVSWNHIASLVHGKMFSSYKNLNYIDLSYNSIAQIDGGTFKDLPRLTYLDLSHNGQLHLERNGASFQGVEYSLLHLNLDNISLNAIPALPTPNLVSLSLAYNSLPNIPPELSVNMTNLQRLNLDYNDLTTVPLVTHSLLELRHLSMNSNPVTFLTNTSLLGVADHLVELDIRNFELNNLEAGAFCKMYSLQTLKLNWFKDLKMFNLPTLLQWSSALRNLEIHVPISTENDLSKESSGIWPLKLRNITFSGKGLKKLGDNILHGIQYPNLHICVTNTSILKISDRFFKNVGEARNITVDVRNNKGLKSLMNPSSGSRPNLHRRTFLMDLKIQGNKWDCDCDLGWIEVWHRKRRQYLCDEEPVSQGNYLFTRENHDELGCRIVTDDLRVAACANKNNNSVIEVLKTDIECGWSTASKIDHLNYVFASLVSFLVAVFLF